MAKQRLLFLGGAGLLASSVHRILLPRGRFELVSLSRQDVDVADEALLQQVIETYKPDCVFNGTGFLGPDKCEAEPQKSHDINFLAVQRLCNVLKKMKGPRLIHFSTDYVFDGKEGGYSEETPARPLSYYGMHKLLADEGVLHADIPAYIFRVASIVGAPLGKPDIIKALLARHADGGDLSVVQDMELSTVSAQFIADALEVFIEKQPPYGIYNLVAEGKTTWFDIVRVAFDELDLRVPLTPIAASAFPRTAPRPMKSWLLTNKLAGILGAVPHWEDMVRAQVHAERDMYLSYLIKENAA